MGPKGTFVIFCRLAGWALLSSCMWQLSDGINQATAVTRPLGHWQPLRERVLVPTQSWFRTNRNNAHWWRNSRSYHFESVPHSCCPCEDQDSESSFQRSRQARATQNSQRLRHSMRTQAASKPWPLATIQGPHALEASITSSASWRLQWPSFAFWSMWIHQVRGCI